MINIKKFSWIAALGLIMATSSCTDLDEKVYDRIDATTFYKNEASVKGAIATIYNQAGNCFAERFYFLQELPADQISWRVWNGGQWGYDEGEKYVLYSDMDLRVENHQGCLDQLLAYGRTCQ